MWQQIRSNKRKSAVLVVLMAAVLFGLGYFLAEVLAPDQPDAGLIGLAVAFAVWVIMWTVSYYQGDNIFLSIAGARKIEKKDLPTVWNVVEEMTIAAGLPKMPDVYVIDDRSPNAFATGRDPQHAAVAVTSGLLSVCNRDELQGVIAHELGHIKNRDTLLMLMAGVMVGAIVILADLGARAMWLGGGRSRSRRSSSSSGGGGAQAVIVILAILLMILGPIVAHLIYFAISRRREYLADASSALFTRYPEGLASALEKIAGAGQPVARATRATAPLYIINPLKGGAQAAAGLTSTHPATAERVRILRAMGGASLRDYDEASRKVHGSGLVPAGALVGTQTVAQREAGKLSAMRGETAPAAQPERKRQREVNDFLFQATGYRFLTCGCGSVLKIPPGFAGVRVSCPHCGTVHAKDEFEAQRPER